MARWPWPIRTRSSPPASSATPCGASPSPWPCRAGTTRPPTAISISAASSWRRTASGGSWIPERKARPTTAAFTDFVSGKSEATATLDLTAAYAENASQVIRSFRLERGKSFTVTDRITCVKPSAIRSFFHTRAEVELGPDGRTALLSRNGKSLRVTLTEPAGAAFRAMPAEPLPTSPDPEANTPNPGLSKLAVHLEGATDAVISVRFERGE